MSLFKIDVLAGRTHKSTLVVLFKTVGMILYFIMLITIITHNITRYATYLISKSNKPEHSYH